MVVDRVVMPLAGADFGHPTRVLNYSDPLRFFAGGEVTCFVTGPILVVMLIGAD